MEPYDMENTKVAVQTTLMEKANWKLVLENNRECYHCNGSHPELLQTLLEWDDTNDPRASQNSRTTWPPPLPHGKPRRSRTCTRATACVTASCACRCSRAPCR